MVMGDMEMQVDLAIIGGGPGGYSAALRAADLGLDVAMIDPHQNPGGASLYNGCIPAKGYLQVAELLLASSRAARLGVSFAPPVLDFATLVKRQQEISDHLAENLARLCDSRGILRIKGTAHFIDPTTLRLEGADISRLRCQNIIIATGATPKYPPGLSTEDTNRIMTTATAFNFKDIPKDLLVVGGGCVGLELGTIYGALGSRVTLAEQTEQLLPGVDADLVAPLIASLSGLFAEIRLGASVVELTEHETHVEARLQTTSSETVKRFDKILLAIGRQPATSGLGLERADLHPDANGFITVDTQQQTSQPGIFAVGDVTGSRMHAHSAAMAGKVAAEVICRVPSAFDQRAIPSVVYTIPQIAWCGLTESEAAKENIPVQILTYLWRDSERAQTMNTAAGLTKLIVTPGNGRILGLGITGSQAENLIAEGVLAIEMGALAEDLALSLHPCPTLSETINRAAENIRRGHSHI